MKTGTISAIFNSSGKLPVDMELFIQFVIGSAISSFAILIFFAGTSLLELLLQSISSINLISTNQFKFKIKGILIFILNHLDTRMVAETRNSCENIRMVRGVISPVEYTQIFCNINKIITEGFRNI